MKIIIDVSPADKVGMEGLEAAAERLFEILVNDPSDTFPEFRSVDGWDVRP
jgi:hypothetical protein